MKLLRSLQARVLALVLAGVTAVWLAAAAVTWHEAREELDDLLDGHLAQAAALLVLRQADGIDTAAADDARIAAAPTKHHDDEPKVAFQVWRGRTLLARSANAPATPMAAIRRGFATTRIDGDRWRVFAAEGRERGVQVYVGEELDARKSILEHLVTALLMPLLVALPLMALLLWWAVRRGLLPLRRLGRAIAEREPSALQPIAAGEPLPGEIAPLVAALNQLFERIAALLDSERRFTADAAHELRTPIAAIRAQAQVAQGAGSDDAARSQALVATLAGCDRATRLVEQLLTLARLESAATAARETVDLAAIAREVLAELAPAALAQRQTIELEADGTWPVRGSATLLMVLLRNLADNALRYGGDGVRLRVALSREGARTVLSVEDSGPGLSDEQRARLGERFFRVLGTQAPGSGLGWSIVRRIAAVHGAEVSTARSAALGGLVVRVGFAD